MQAFHTWVMMDGWAAYVWPAYGLTFAVLVYLGIATFTRWRRAKAALKRVDAA